MPQTILIRRTTTGNLPATLAFGELAFSDIGNRLAIGKSGGAIYEFPLGAGTVTSVGLSLPGSLFSVTGSPVTNTGTLTASLASQAANQIFASPNGAAGAPTFRGLVPADFATLPTISSWAAAASSINFNGQKGINVGTPTASGDAANKSYVDSLVSTGNNKGTARVATTATLTLTSATATTIVNTGNLPTALDGVTLAAGNLILVKDQTGAGATGAAANGLYVYTAGTTWTRATVADTSAEMAAGAFIFVSEGSQNADQGYTLVTDDPITLGTTQLTFTQTSSAGQITAGAGLTKTGNQLDIVGTTNRIVVNADSIDIGTDIVTLSGSQTLTNKTIGGSQISGNITGNAANVTGTVAIANGGTGGTTAAQARTNLGLAVGTDVQAFNSRLTSLSSASFTNNEPIIWNGSAFASSTVIDGGTF